jgi:hypothetical protein
MIEKMYDINPLLSSGDSMLYSEITKKQKEYND